MKRALVIATILAALGALGLWMAWPHPADPSRARSLDARRFVGRVLVAREAAYRRSRTPNGRAFSPAKFNRLIQNVGAVSCPKQFQLAWLDYQAAWVQRARDQAGKNGEALVDVALLFVPGAQLEAVAGAAKQSKRQVADTAGAWFSVKREAVIFNCPVPSDAGDF